MKRIIDRYFSEQFPFGGEIKNRYEIIEELAKITGDQKLIDRYLQGMDTAKEKS